MAALRRAICLLAVAVAGLVRAQGIEVLPSVPFGQYTRVARPLELPARIVSNVLHVNLPAQLSLAPNDFLHIQTLAGSRLLSVAIAGRSMSVPLANVRQSVEVLYMQNATRLIVAASGPLHFDELFPAQGHLALGKEPNQISITWVMNETTEAQVRYGSNPLKLDRVANATSLTYRITDMCAAPANETQNFLDPGFIYTAVMTDLVAGQRVWYSYGSPSAGWTTPTFFHMGPKDPQVFRFIAFGDLGVTPKQAPAELSTLRMQEHLNTTDLVVHIGDISYARGHAYLWEDFFREIEPIATHVPYMTSIGNHEYDFIGQPFKPEWSTYSSDSGGECGVPYVARFAMPYIDDSRALKNRTLYYSFSYGPVHFAMLDSEVDFLPDSAQHNWLKRDLALVDRDVTPFVIVTSHRPMYDSSWGGLLPEVTALRDAIEPLLVTYQVDLVLVGHIHVYQRSCTVVSDECNAFGTIHLTIGMAGNIAQTPWNGEPSWLQYRSLNHGITLFEVTNSTAMHVQFVRDTTGEIEDDFWVTR